MQNLGLVLAAFFVVCSFFEGGEKVSIEQLTVHAANGAVVRELEHGAVLVSPSPLGWHQPLESVENAPLEALSVNARIQIASLPSRREGFWRWDLRSLPEPALWGLYRMSSWQTPAIVYLNC